MRSCGPISCAKRAVPRRDTTIIAMEYVDGLSLRERLDESGAVPPREAVQLGIQAADALAYAHEHGVVHRDFKAAKR